MKLAFLFALVTSCWAQSSPAVTNTTGSELPNSGICSSQANVGSQYLRSNDPANAPSGLYMCQRTGPGVGGFGWVLVGGASTGNCSTLGGDVTGTCAASVVQRINGTALSGLATGILKNTTSTGVPSIAIAADFPTLNQNTTGSAAAAPFSGITSGTNAAAAMVINTGASLSLSGTGTVTSNRAQSVAFASLGTPSNSQTAYCSDCTVTSSIDNTCAGSGTGAWAVRINGAWK